MPEFISTIMYMYVREDFKMLEFDLIRLNCTN